MRATRIGGADIGMEVVSRSLIRRLVHQVDIVRQRRWSICEEQPQMRALNDLRQQSGLDVPDLDERGFECEDIRFMKRYK